MVRRAATRRFVEYVGDGHGVGHHREARDVDEAASQCIGRRSGRDPDGGTRHHQGDRGIGDGVLLGLLESRLGCEARLEQRASRTGRGPAVHLLEQAAVVEQLQVAPDGHIRHAQLAGEVRYTDSTVLADALQDQRLALACEHVNIPARCARSK